jgi:hypothetical protein
LFGLINVGESEQPLRTGMKGHNFSLTKSFHYIYMEVCTIEKIYHHANVPRLSTPFRTDIEDYWIRELDRKVWRYQKGYQNL